MFEIPGQPVTVLFQERDMDGFYPDERSGPVTRKTIENVLVAPVSSDDLAAGEARQLSDKTRAVFYMPKTVDFSLRDCRLETRDGRVWDVEGDPIPYPAELAAGPRNLVVYASLVEG